MVAWKLNVKSEGSFQWIKNIPGWKNIMNTDGFINFKRIL